MAKNMAGTTDFDVRPDDGIWLAMNGVDNKIDDFFGVRPLRMAARVLTVISPANIICTVTDLEKPSKLIEEKMDDLERDLVSKKLGKPF